MIQKIEDLSQYNNIKNDKSDFILMFYSENSQKSLQMVELIESLKTDNNEISIYAVNVAENNKIHPLLAVNSVPTVILFKNGNVVKKLEGLLGKDSYKRLIEGQIFQSQMGEEKPGHKVTVYTTPTCSWCTRVKSYLNDNQILYREIDVSKNQKVAEELVKRSGQTGVPQIEIDGHLIVGFDKAQINRRLEIHSN